MKTTAICAALAYTCTRLNGVSQDQLEALWTLRQKMRNGFDAVGIDPAEIVRRPSQYDATIDLDLTADDLRLLLNTRHLWRWNMEADTSRDGVLIQRIQALPFQLGDMLEEAERRAMVEKMTPEERAALKATMEAGDE